jgi:tetratricopeptide (TPR) repeat protein
LATAIQAQGLFPTELDWFYFQALSLFHLDQFAEAKAALVAGQAKGLDEDHVHRVMYRISLAQGDKKTALDIAHQMQAEEQKALAEKGGHTGYNLGEWAFRYVELLVDFGRLEEAEKYLSHLCKQSHDWAIVARQLCPTADSHLTLKCAQEALKDEKLTSGDRDMALFARAIASQNLDDPKAHQYFEQLRDEFPRSADIYDQLAIYAVLQGDFDEAEILAEQALVYGRDSWFSWVVMGLVQFLKGDQPAAIGDLQKGMYRNKEILNPGPQFRWLYYALSGDQASAATWKEQAYSQAKSAVDRQLLELIQSHL